MKRVLKAFFLIIIITLAINNTGCATSSENANDNYTDNGEGTVTDKVTGLMWQKDMGKINL